METRQKTRNILIYALIIVGTLIIINIIFIFIELQSKVSQEQALNTKRIDIPNDSSFVTNSTTTLLEMQLPAVDSEGNGVTSSLIVKATSGSGKTLVNIDNLIFWADTQQSIRVAKAVASRISNTDINSYDIEYSVKANASLIGGPSAGAALAIATTAVFLKKPVKQDVMITGSINHDSTIGPVGEILEKAKAAKSAGALTFLVPLGQGQGIFYQTKEHCETFGISEVCTIETKPLKIDLEKESGIKIIEVETIEQALEYFT